MGLSRMIKEAKRGAIVSPVHEHWLSQHNEVELSHPLSEWVADQLRQKQRSRVRTFTGSQRGSCARAQVFGFLGFPRTDKFTSDTNSILINGTWMHLKWQVMGFQAGWLEEAEVPIREREFRFTGVLDGVLTGGEGLELKSINDRSYKFMIESGPHYKHLLQIHAYMLASKRGVFSLIYENKSTQEWKEWVVEQDPEIMETVVSELAYVNMHVDEKAYPPKVDACLDKCDPKCPFSAICDSPPAWPKGIVIK